MVPFSSQGEQYWGVGGVGGGLFGPPAENFGMTSTTFFYLPGAATFFMHVLQT